jgi:hypothetical protein
VARVLSWDDNDTDGKEPSTGGEGGAA